MSQEKYLNTACELLDAIPSDQPHKFPYTKQLLQHLAIDSLLMDGIISGNDLNIIHNYALLKEQEADPKLFKLIIESIHIAKQNASSAYRLKNLLAHHSYQHRPLVILNLHHDTAHFNLLNQCLDQLIGHNYTQFALEAAPENIIEFCKNLFDGADQFQKDIEKEPTQKAKVHRLKQTVEEYLAECQTLFNNIQRHGEEILHGIYQNNVCSTTTENIDICFLLDYCKASSEAPFVKNVMKHGLPAKLHLTDHRSPNDDLDELTAEQTSDLRDIGFVFEIVEIALKSQQGVVQAVGLAHGPGILARYQTLFPDLPQPIALLPCHYTIGPQSLNLHAYHNQTSRERVHQYETDLLSYDYIRLDLVMGIQSCLEKLMHVVSLGGLPATSKAMTTTSDDHIISTKMARFFSFNCTITDGEYKYSRISISNNNLSAIDVLKQTMIDLVNGFKIDAQYCRIAIEQLKFRITGEFLQQEFTYNLALPHRFLQQISERASHDGNDDVILTIKK